jgi:hypothetical protein
MKFVSIGIDCDVANFLNKYNLRKASLPFDWNVSYNGVSKCIECDFDKFTEPLSNDRINDKDVYFHHDFLEAGTADKDKYNRRCLRLLNIFKEASGTGGTGDVSEYILFIRKGHMCYHHEEQNGKYKDITCDIKDAQSLDKVLQRKYPRLKYKIIVVVGCTSCFKKDTNFTKYVGNGNGNGNIEVYNNVCDASEDRNKLFEECLLNVCIEKIREDKEKQAREKIIF